MSEKNFRQGLGQFLIDNGFEKTGFFGRGPLLRADGVRVDMTSKEVKRRRQTDVRVYATPPEEGIQERFEELELLKRNMGKHIYSMADVNNEFYGDDWDPEKNKLTVPEHYSAR